MTRSPRLSQYIYHLTRHVRTRIPAGLSLPAGLSRTTISRTAGSRTAGSRKAVSRKALAYTSAGLALGGVAGAAAAAGLLGDPAIAAGSRPAVSRPAQGHAASGRHTSKHTTPAKHEETWAAAVARIVVSTIRQKPRHAQLPAQDILTPVGTTGPQTWMPITPARYANAKTIVRQAVAKHMGLRSAVIAVATSMQESTLLNLPYGDSDSLGLFQQRPSCGWGTPAQIQRPAYAAGAFFHALRGYQASNPDWARQPVWEPAQGVQGSAFPTAYARWEAQAAHLVATVAKKRSDPSPVPTVPPTALARTAAAPSAQGRRDQRVPRLLPPWEAGHTPRRPRWRCADALSVCHCLPGLNSSGEIPAQSALRPPSSGPGAC